MKRLALAILALGSTLAFADVVNNGNVIYYTNAGSPLGIIYNPALQGAVQGSGVGAFDNAAIINAGFSGNTNQYVYLPAGTWHIKSPINVPSNGTNCLVGAPGWGTIIDVDMDFSPAATGVINFTQASTLQSNKPCLHNIKINEHLPPDITATASAATSGATTITISGATGTITNSMYVVDKTTSAAIPIASGGALTGVAGTAYTVGGVAGNVITLSRAIAANVNAGDEIHFAQPRSGFAALGTCNTQIAGGAPCQYPWVVYSINGANSLDLDYIQFPNAYNGIYIRAASQFHLGFIQGAVFNIGLDVDNVHNFPQIDDYEIWGFDISPSLGYYAIQDNYYDGNMVAANIGATDGAAIGKMQIWSGQLNFTSTFSWAQIDELMLDGNNANMNINGCLWAQIGKLYSTKGVQSAGPPYINMAATNCRISIGDLSIGNSRGPFITQSAGTFRVASGYVWDGIPGNSAGPMISQTGGHMFLDNMIFDGGSAGTSHTYIRQTGGDLNFNNNTVIMNFVTGGVMLSLTDTALNNVGASNQFNGWGFTPPGTIGLYGLSCSGTPSASFASVHGVITHC